MVRILSPLIRSLVLKLNLTIIGARRGGFGGGRAQGGKRAKPEVTVDALNAELDAYSMQD